MDFADDSDVSFTLRNDIQNIFGNVMRLTMLKGSPSGFATDSEFVSHDGKTLGEQYKRGPRIVRTRRV